MEIVFVVQWLEHKENFLKRINNKDQFIKFTVEDTHPDGSMPFLDTLVTQEQNKSQFISVYRKPSPHRPIHALRQPLSYLW